jgi:hypothetical protein
MRIRKEKTDAVSVKKNNCKKWEIKKTYLKLKTVFFELSTLSTGFNKKCG